METYLKTFKTPKGTDLPLTNLKGKDYLQVCWRIVWFRQECPNYSIETEFLSINQDAAIAKAIIKDDKGRIIATSHKTETKIKFAAGHGEKAETGAIGRALALCGFGTQFCGDELDEGENIVDAPVQSPHKPSVTFPKAQDKPAGASTAPTQGKASNTVSEAQIKRMYAIAHGSGWTNEDVKTYIVDKFGYESSKELTRLEYDSVCSTIQSQSFADAIGYTPNEEWSDEEDVSL